MEKLTDITKALMEERFGKDSVIALATTADDLPYVRYVNAYYQDGAFYVITYALSGKMKQMAKNPAVAIAGDWFTARGVGENLGYIRRPETLRWRKSCARPLRNGLTMGIIISTMSIHAFYASGSPKACFSPTAPDMTLILQRRFKERKKAFLPLARGRKPFLFSIPLNPGIFVCSEWPKWRPT